MGDRFWERILKEELAGCTRRRDDLGHENRIETKKQERIGVKKQA